MMDKKEFLDHYLVRRRGTDCCKWDELGSRYGDEDLISMWVADMDFKTCDAVIEAMTERIHHGAFGYAGVPDSYYEAFSNWMERHYQLPVAKKWVRFSTGCVTAIAWAIHAFTKPGDACLILTPVYYPFHDVVKNNGRKLAMVDLDYHNESFTMNYEAIEKAIIKHRVRLFIQCSPHNPVGRVWREEELERVMEICKRHGVLVVSDEIHQDIVIGNNRFMPAAAVRNGRYQDMVITLSAASKTFNLAGLVHSHIVIMDDALMEQYDRFARGMNRTSMNIAGLTATEAAYRYGDAWHGNILQVIEENYRLMKAALNEYVPEITVIEMEGTYLLLLDLRKLVPLTQIKDFIQTRCRLAVDYGEWFGKNFAGFIRLNLATDPKYVEQAAANIIREAQAIRSK